MLSVWRTYLANAADGDELRVVQEIVVEICPLSDNILSSLIDVLHRRSAITKETLPIIQAYDFDLETLRIKNLHKMRLGAKIQSWSSLLNSSASTLLWQKQRYDSWDRLASIQLPLEFVWCSLIFIFVVFFIPRFFVGST